MTTRRVSSPWALLAVLLALPVAACASDADEATTETSAQEAEDVGEAADSVEIDTTAPRTGPPKDVGRN